MKQSSKKMNCQSGFTLIELVIVVAVIGIVAAFAVAADNSSKSAVSGSAREIFVIMQAARMEAIKTGRNALIERTGISNIRVYIDENGDAVIGSGDRLSADFDLIPKTIMPNELQSVSYNNQGYLVNTTNNRVSIEISVCAQSKSDPNACLNLDDVATVLVGLSGIPSVEVR